MVFYAPLPVICDPVAVGLLSPFIDTFLTSILCRFWDLAGAQKSTENRHFAERDVPGTVFLRIFAAPAVFLDFCIDFGAISS